MASFTPGVPTGVVAGKSGLRNKLHGFVNRLRMEVSSWRKGSRSCLLHMFPSSYLPDIQLELQEPEAQFQFESQWIEVHDAVHHVNADQEGDNTGFESTDSSRAHGSLAPISWPRQSADTCLGFL